MAYPSYPNTAVTGNTWTASAANENYAAIVTGVVSGEKDINIAVCKCSNISFDSTVAFGGNALKFYHGSATVDSGDVVNGYVSVNVDAGIANTSIVAFLVLPTGFDVTLTHPILPYDTNEVYVRTGYAYIHLSDDVLGRSLSTNVEGHTLSYTIIVRA